jgi:hypothetical protein
MAVIKKTTTDDGEDEGKRNAYTLFLGVLYNVSTIKISIKAPQIN